MSEREIEELKVLIAEKEAAIRRKEKKLEQKKKAESGAPLKQAEARLKESEERRGVAVEESREAFKRTLSNNGVPLVQRKQELLAEIEKAQGEQEERKQELANLEHELNQHTEVYNNIIAEKHTFCNDLLSYVSELQDELLSKLALVSGDSEHTPEAPYHALQIIEELTKERESEISNNERQLREICQIITMKKDREAELKVESEKKIRDAIIKKDDEILVFVQQCQRERADILEKVERLRAENEQQAQLLHWKSQKTLRDMKDRKIDRKSNKVPIREQITTAENSAVPKKKGDKTKAASTPAPSEKEKAPYVDPNVLEQNRNDLREKRDSKQLESDKIRKLEADIARVQQEFQRTQRQLEYKISYERGQAEQFERENQKLEEQAEHLAQTLQRMKAEIKKQQTAAEQQNASANKSIGWNAQTPRRSPRPTEHE